MISKALEVSDMVVSISIDGHFNGVSFKQLAPATITVKLGEEGVVDSVFADEGITFTDGMIQVRYKPGADITSICDRRELSKKLRESE